MQCQLINQQLNIFFWNIGSDTVESVNGGLDHPVTLEEIDLVQESLNRMSSDFGSFKATMEAKIAYYEEQKISYSGYKSHVMDTDIAEESTTFAREQLRSQTASAMLAQANSQRQVALSLLP